MKTRALTTSVVAVTALVIGLAACQKSEDGAGQGPAAKAGEQIDRATGQAAENLNKAREQTGEALQKAGEKGGEAAQKAGEKMGGAAQESTPPPEEPKKE
jgi:hypothetical protein